MGEGGGLKFVCGQFDEQIDVIGLNFCFVCGTVSADFAAFIAFVDDNVAFFGIGLHADRAEDTTAGVGAVTGIDVHVQGTEAFGAMIAGAVTKGFYFKAAVFADERIVVFGKAFLFHGKSSFSFLFYYDTPEGAFCQEKIPFQRKGIFNKNQLFSGDIIFYPTEYKKDGGKHIHGKR